MDCLPTVQRMFHCQRIHMRIHSGIAIVVVNTHPALIIRLRRLSIGCISEWAEAVLFEDRLHTPILYALYMCE